MRTRMLPAVLLAGLLALSSCSSEESSPGGDADNTEKPTKTVTQTADDDAGDETQKSTAPSSDKNDGNPNGKDKDKDNSSKLVLKVHGEKTTIKPDQVYCKGSSGHIRHIIGKTHNQPPLVKAEGKHFAMVKPGQGEPYKAKRPSGLSYGKKSVKFNKTRLGPAKLTGTMTCTKWED